MENLSRTVNQKSLLHKETSINMFQFRISNGSLVAKNLKFSVFSEFQRYLIPSHSFQVSCLQNIKEGLYTESAKPSHGPGAQPEVMPRIAKEGASFPLALEFINEKKRKARSVGISGRGKATNEYVPRLSASLGKTIDSIKNQTHKSTQISQTKHN